MREQVDAAKSRYAAGVFSVDSKQTLEQFLNQWLEERAEGTIRPRTRENYAGVIRNHRVPELGNVRLNQLTPQHVQRLLNKKTSAGSPHLVRNIRAVLRAALGQAVKWGMLVRNVAVLVETPKVPQSNVEPFSIEEARCLLSSVEGERLEAVFVVTLLTGMRRGEVLGLQWDDVNFDAKQLRVTGNLQRVAGRLQRAEPKTDESRRTIDVPQMVLDSLRVHRTAQKEERLKAGPAWVDGGYVFTTRLGTPIEPRNVYREFVAAVAKAGLRPQRFHDLRHCFATLQLAEGVPLRVVSERLGHTRSGTTC